MMRKTSWILIALCLCAASSFAATPAASQTTVSEEAKKLEELKKWIKEAKSYQEWISRWRNRVAWNGGNFITSRMRMPLSPEWLSSRCEVVRREVTQEPTWWDDAYMEACQLLDDLTQNFATQAAKSKKQQQAATQQDKEKPHKTKFWERIHADALWFTTQTGGQHVMGNVGTHMTFEVAGRVQTFGPPGMLLVSVPDGKGGRRLQVAYTWGFSIQLFDFRIPGTRQHARAYYNQVKAWSFGGENNVMAARSGMNMGGLSITLKDKR